MMRSLHRGFLSLALVLFVGGLAGVGWYVWSRPVKVAYRTVPVSRASVEAAVTAAGVVQAVNRTEMRCELEELPVDGIMVHGVNILELTPEGTHVQKGDVICRFDDSRYQELVRRQQIKVLRDEADLKQVTFERDAAAVGARAFREGEAKEKIESYQGQIALLQADLQRARDRLAWSQELLHLGYGTTSQLATDQATLFRLEVQLENAAATLKNFRAFVSPRTQRQLDVQVEIKELNRSLYEVQYQRSLERLEHYEELIEACTLRAPHDGILIYASLLFGDAPKLSEGGHVHYGMRMFYLPDLSKLVVQVQLYESVVDEVKVGMLATVRLEALSDREVQGRVISIDPVPTDNWRAGLDIHQFRAQVELIDPPAGTLPDMSAEARIVTGRRKDALVVPTEALAILDGWPYCYVEGPAAWSAGWCPSARPTRATPSWWTVFPKGTAWCWTPRRCGPVRRRRSTRCTNRPPAPTPPRTAFRAPPITPRDIPPAADAHAG